MIPQVLKIDKKVPDVRPGDIARVYCKIKEGKKEREQAFEGVVIKRSKGAENGASFVVRKISQGIGVERKFLIYSPFLTKVQVKKRSKVRRADLSYLRNVRQIAKKLKDKKIDPFEEVLAVKVEEEKPVTKKVEKEEKEEEKKSPKKESQKKEGKKQEEKKEEFASKKTEPKEKKKEK